MGVKHKAIKKSGDILYASEWNAEHDNDMRGEPLKNLGVPIDPNDAIRKVDLDEMYNKLISKFGLYIGNFIKWDGDILITSTDWQEIQRYENSKLPGFFNTYEIFFDACMPNGGTGYISFFYDERFNGGLLGTRDELSITGTFCMPGICWQHLHLRSDWFCIGSSFFMAEAKVDNPDYPMRITCLYTNHAGGHFVNILED